LHNIPKNLKTILNKLTNGGKMKQMEEQQTISGYRVIKDLIDKVKEKVKLRWGFPKEVEIKEAKLLFSPYDNSYLAYIKYNIDGVDYETKRPITTNLQETVAEMLCQIEDYYERMHRLD